MNCPGSPACSVFVLLRLRPKLLAWGGCKAWEFALLMGKVKRLKCWSCCQFQLTQIAPLWPLLNPIFCKQSALAMLRQEDFHYLQLQPLLQLHSHISVSCSSCSFQSSTAKLYSLCCWGHYLAGLSRCTWPLMYLVALHLSKSRLKSIINNVQLELSFNSQPAPLSECLRISAVCWISHAFLYLQKAKAHLLKYQVSSGSMLQKGQIKEETPNLFHVFVPAAYHSMFHLPLNCKRSQHKRRNSKISQTLSMYH